MARRTTRTLHSAIKVELPMPVVLHRFSKMFTVHSCETHEVATKMGTP